MIVEQRVPLRQRRDLSQIIEAAVNLYLRHFWPLFSIAAVVIPVGIAMAVFQASIEDELALAIVVTTLGVLQAIANLLAGAALIAALGDLDGGRPPDFSRAYDVAFERFWRVLGSGVLVVLIAGVPLITIIGTVGAVYLLILWLFVEQAIILHGATPAGALSISAGAVIGSWWRTLGIALVIWVIGAVPASLIAGLFMLTPVLVSGTVNSVVNAALLPFAVTAMTLLYFDLKLRKEPPIAAGL